MNNIHSKPGFAKGLRPVDNSRAHLKFGDFLTGLPTTPLVDLAPNYNYPMDLNDQIGDCVVAAFDHFNQVVTGLLTGTELNFDQEMLIKFYQTQNPNFDINGTAETNGPGGSADNGMNIQEFLEYLQQNGYILGFARIDQTNQQEVQSAIYIGLALMCGVTLQDIQMQQFNEGQPWNPVEGSPIDGGHGVPAVGFPSSTETTFVTWAKLQQATQAFITNSVTEMWFVLTKYHVAHPNFRDNFDLESFTQAVKEITGGQVVVPTPTPTPTPTMETTVVLTRTSDDGKETIGNLVVTTPEGTSTFVTLEKPWLGDRPNVSCIPKGTYQCLWAFQPDLNQNHYEVQNVVNRSGIFIHEGNFVADTQGCILVGTSVGEIGTDTEPDILQSVSALTKFETLLAQQPFTLTIQ